MVVVPRGCSACSAAWLDTLLGTGPVFLLVLRRLRRHRRRSRPPTTATSAHGRSTTRASRGRVAERDRVDRGPMNFAVPPPSTERIESTHRRRPRAARRCIVAPIAILGVGLWRGVDAALRCALALAHRGRQLPRRRPRSLGWTARRRAARAHRRRDAAASSCRLVVITVIGVGIKELDIVDWPVFCITLIVVVPRAARSGRCARSASRSPIPA